MSSQSWCWFQWRIACESGLQAACEALWPCWPRWVWLLLNTVQSPCSSPMGAALVQEIVSYWHMSAVWAGRCHCHACRKGWELSLGSQTSSPPALDWCTGLGQHWYGVFWGGCGGSAAGLTLPAWFVLMWPVLRWGWRRLCPYHTGLGSFCCWELRVSKWAVVIFSVTGEHLAVRSSRLGHERFGGFCSHSG